MNEHQNKIGTIRNEVSNPFLAYWLSEGLSAHGIKHTMTIGKDDILEQMTIDFEYPRSAGDIARALIAAWDPKDIYYNR